MGESYITKDHTTIQKWVKERGGKPALVKDTENRGSGVIRINFTGYNGKNSLKEITWKEFFNIFDEKNLSFLYQNKTSSNKESRFFKFIKDEKKP
jgi:hypothetical protein